MKTAEKQVYIFNLIHMFFLIYILKYRKTRVIINIISGVYFADLLSGLLHYYFDNYKGDVDFLKNISKKSFLDHHDDPGAIITSTFIDDINQTTRTYPIAILIFFSALFCKK